MGPLWGNFSVCPLLCQFQLPHHCQVELSSLNGLKAWGEGQKLCHDIAFLLVLAEDEVTEARNYGLSTIFVNPSQARVPCIEEVVGKLNTCASSGPDWPYALVWLHEGTHHVPFPKEGHVGILPMQGVVATPCRQISQLEIYQLLIASHQIIYLITLNGHSEPIITSLQEPLASGISLIAGEPVYLEMDIPPPQVEEPDQKVLPLGEVSTIIIASPHKSTPPKSEGEGSMTREVRDLLSQAILETSGHSSESSTPRRLHPVTVLMPPSHQPKELLQLVDTSSQVSIEMAETSLEGIPTSISPIAVTSRSESISPLADAMELHTNANKALKELLTTKASLDTCRWRAIWELGMELCQNESKATESIKEAKATCSQANLDAQALCFMTIKEAKAVYSHATLEAKATCLGMVKEAKKTHTCSI